MSRTLLGNKSKASTIGASTFHGDEKEKERPCSSLPKLPKANSFLWLTSVSKRIISPVIKGLTHQNLTYNWSYSISCNPLATVSWLNHQVHHHSSSPKTLSTSCDLKSNLTRAVASAVVKCLMMFDGSMPNLCLSYLGSARKTFKQDSLTQLTMKMT